MRFSLSLVLAFSMCGVAFCQSPTPPATPPAATGSTCAWSWDHLLALAGPCHTTTGSQNVIEHGDCPCSYKLDITITLKPGARFSRAPGSTMSIQREGKKACAASLKEKISIVCFEQVAPAGSVDLTAGDPVVLGMDFVDWFTGPGGSSSGSGSGAGGSLPSPDGMPRRIKSTALIIDSECDQSCAVPAPPVVVTPRGTSTGGAENSP